MDNLYSFSSIYRNILTFKKKNDKQNDGSANGIRYFNCSPEKGIFVSPSYARIEDNHDNAAEDEEELEKTDESQVRKRTSSSDLLKDEWYVEMFAPELHALEEARSVSKQRIEDVDTAAEKKTTPHSSKLDEHQRQVLSDFTKNMASGLVRVANEEREIPWDRDVREHDEKNFF